MTQNKIFISHATPEDSEFAVWLALKLELFGYKTWVDTNSLDPAVDFWDTIESAIRNESIRFIFVVTKASINKDGVKKELAVADRVRRSLENFIIPVRLDDIDFNDFPTEIIRLNAIDFKDNWGKGLCLLLGILEKSNIPKTSTNCNSEEIVNRWNSIRLSQNNAVLIREEEYVSNLFELSLPENIYIYNIFDSDVIGIIPYTYKRIGNLVITFACKDCIGSITSNMAECRTLLVIDALNNKYENIKVFGIEIKNLNRICIELINRNISLYYKKAGLLEYQDNRTYYFKSGTKSKYHSSSLSIKLSGNRRDKHWHYGIDSYFISTPIR